MIMHRYTRGRDNHAARSRDRSDRIRRRSNAGRYSVMDRALCQVVAREGIQMVNRAVPVDIRMSALHQPYLAKKSPRKQMHHV